MLRKLHSGDFQRQNTAGLSRQNPLCSSVGSAEIKAAGSLFISRYERCHAPAQLSIHQDCCQHFPLALVLKQQYSH